MELLAKLSNVKRIYSFGAVLIDELPTGRSLGGAPFNFAYYTHLFGVATELISTIGADEEGREILSFFEKIGMSNRWLKTNAKSSTALIKVTLNSLGVPTFLVRENASYDWIDTVPEDNKEAIIYFGSGEQRAEISRNTLLNYIDANRHQAIIFCDLNLRAPHFTETTILDSLSRSDILKISEEELAEISRSLKLPFESEAQRIHALFERFDLVFVVLTRGSDGATLFTREKRFSFSAPKIDPVLDTVGAGDAFCARFIASLIKGRNLEEALQAAVQFASEICRYPGAIVPASRISQWLCCS